MSYFDIGYLCKNYPYIQSLVTLHYSFYWNNSWKTEQKIGIKWDLFYSLLLPQWKQISNGRYQTLLFVHTSHYNCITRNTSSSGTSWKTSKLMAVWEYFSVLGLRSLSPVILDLRQKMIYVMLKLHLLYHKVMLPNTNMFLPTVH